MPERDFTNVPSDWIVEFDLKTNNSHSLLYGFGASSPLNQNFTAFGFDSIGNMRTYTKSSSTSSITVSSSSYVSNDFNTIKIVKEGSTVSYYCNGTLLTTDTASFFGSVSSFTFKGDIWQNRTIEVKNLKIKPL